MPEEVRGACEQYLIYFLEFLRDLGVKATGELKHEATQVLFTVTPASGPDALDKIREALDVYLRLPGHAGALTVTSGEDEIRALKLEGAVHNLASQLRLAEALIRANETTIEAQRETINQLRAFSSAAGLTGAIRHVSEPHAADREAVLDGLVTIRPLEVKGAEINLPEIFRRLRALFGTKPEGPRSPAQPRGFLPPGRPKSADEQEG